MNEVRRIVEGTIRQGVDEEIVYTFSTTPWAAGPSTATMVVKDRMADYADVTTVVTPSP